ncbi:MAG: DUF664 domain-containing protein [Nocardioides sp.]
MTEPVEPEGDLGGEAAHWSAYLDFYRATLAAGVAALPVEAQRTSRVPSGWTPLELLSHVLHMERRWFVWGFLGEDVADPWGDWTVEDPWEYDEGDASVRWQVPDGVTVEDLIARLEELAVRTRVVLRDVPMETTGEPGPRFPDGPPTLRWICQHVVHEYARHAGHLDIVVELGDA